jgi:Domain of unknown function (DUF4173)
MSIVDLFLTELERARLHDFCTASPTNPHATARTTTTSAVYTPPIGSKEGTMDKVIGVFRRNFLIKLGLVVLLVGFGDWLFWQRQYGIGNIGIYGLAMLAALFIVRPATLRSPLGIVASLATALYCVAIIVDIGVLSVILFWTALSIAALAPFASKLEDGWQWFWRLVLHGVMSLFNPILDAIGLKKLAKRSGPRKFGVRAAFSLLALPVIGGTIFFALFVQANPVLEKMVKGLSLPAADSVLLFRFIVWSVVAALIWSVLRPWRHKKHKAMVAPVTNNPQPAVQGAIVSLASIQLSLLVFNALFAMQNGMDLAFMTGLVPLPDDMALAEYAHRGAYPLVATALLAGLFVLTMLQPGGIAARDKVARLLVIVWIVQNVILVASSMLRTWDYVEAYSLTQFRIAALAWMVLVALGLALVCWRMLANKSGGWLINANLLTTGLMLSVFCFVDTAGVAARWNVAHAREVGGRGYYIDLCYLGRMDAAAILPLMSLEARPLPEEFRKRVKHVRQFAQADATSWYEHRGWTWRTERILRAAKAKEATLPVLDLGPHDRDCSGDIYQTAVEPTTPAPPELTPSVTP